VVITANIFALMGLRQLYFLLQGAMDRLVHLARGLSFILAFIGVKMILHALHEYGVHVPDISLQVSLTVIVATLVVTTLTSLYATRTKKVSTK
jgi:tellurite resistance protein TerC